MKAISVPGLDGFQKIHGMAETKTWRAWKNMLKRCYNKNTEDYERYGGRGITVIEAWLDFRNFYADMGESPIGMSLDRINNDAGYSPENCKWSTPAEQKRNQSKSKNITFDGKTMCMRDWENFLGLGHGTLKWRIKNQPLEKAMQPRYKK